MKWPMDKIFVTKKKRRRQDFLWKDFAAGKTYQRKFDFAAGEMFFDWILMGTLSSWCSIQSILHKSQVRIFFL